MGVKGRGEPWTGNEDVEKRRGNKTARCGRGLDGLNVVGKLQN